MQGDIKISTLILKKITEIAMIPSPASNLDPAYEYFMKKASFRGENELNNTPIYFCSSLPTFTRTSVQSADPTCTLSSHGITLCVIPLYLYDFMT